MVIKMSSFKKIILLLFSTLILSGCSTTKDLKDKVTTAGEQKVEEINKSVNEFNKKEDDTSNVQNSKDNIEKNNLNNESNDLFNGVKIAPLSVKPYNRTDYNHWIKGKKLKTVREDILQRDAKWYTVAHGKVKLGRWIDVYSGNLIEDKKKIDIDHIFPLNRANNSGAFSWTADQKEKFANDPENLLAVSSIENREKGAKGPSEWLPSNKDYHKTYVEKYLYIAKKYNLSITPEDKKTILKVLNQ